MRFSWRFHLVCLLVFCAAMVLMWLLPTFFTGLPPVNPRLEHVRLFVETGDIHSKDGRLSIFLYGFFHRFLDWKNVFGWTVLSASLLSLGFLPFWFAVRRLFSVGIAWGSVGLLALLPFYWQEALQLNYYTVALPLLFTTFAVFLSTYERSIWLAVCSAGLLFGFTIAAKDVFLLFFPWFVGAYVWSYRTSWKQASLQAAVFCLLAGLVYMTPMVPRAVHMNAPLTEKLEVLLPGNRFNPADAEFYPDPYTAEFDSEWFNEQYFQEKAAAPSLFDFMRGRNRLLTLGLGDTGIGTRLMIGLWLFVRSVPDVFLQHTLGGAFLWLFYLLGFLILFRSNRRLFWYSIGLIVSTEVIIRFVLYYQRIHTMDYGWLFAIVAVIGIGTLLPAVQKILQVRMPIIIGAFVLLLGLQLVQINRHIFADLYTRSIVPHRLAIAQEMDVLPTDAVVAAPITQLEIYSGTDTILFQQSTIDRLLQQGKIGEAFALYSVTHVMGYTPESTQKIQGALPGIGIVPLPERPSLQVTQWMNFILHVIR